MKESEISIEFYGIYAIKVDVNVKTWQGKINIIKIRYYWEKRWKQAMNIY